MLLQQLELHSEKQDLERLEVLSGIGCFKIKKRSFRKILEKLLKTGIFFLAKIMQKGEKQYFWIY